MDNSVIGRAMRPTTLGVSAAAERLRRHFGTRLLLPADAGYDQVRRVWNGQVDKRPAAIVRCSSAADVVEAVTVGRASGLVVAVRGGGHSMAGVSVCEGGLVIDLSDMKAIAVNPTRRTVRAEPGVKLGEFDASTATRGLATTMGVNSDTGIAGLTLGGGFGRLGRKHGLACDNLIGADMVLADGRLVRASADENADLFWAIRGGGGNFGIVTAFEYRLHPLPAPILGGLVLHDLRHAAQVLHFYRDYAATAPDEVSADVVFLTSPEGQPLLAISACYAGPVEEGERTLGPLRAYGPPLQDLIAPIAYPALQASADPLFPPGRRYYTRAHFLKDLSDAAIVTLIDSYARATSPLSLLVLQQVGGAIARVAPDATAYANRDAGFDCFALAAWEDPADDERHTAWARSFSDAIRPYGTGGAYANNLGEEGDERVRAAYGANYTRLARLKAKYDPDNLFRLNQNIRPAG